MILKEELDTATEGTERGAGGRAGWRPPPRTAGSGRVERGSQADQVRRAGSPERHRLPGGLAGPHRPPAPRRTHSSPVRLADSSQHTQSLKSHKLRSLAVKEFN